jgi:hypothetical protein
MAGVDAVGDELGEETPDLVERQRNQGWSPSALWRSRSRAAAAHDTNNA